MESKVCVIVADFRRLRALVAVLAADSQREWNWGGGWHVNGAHWGHVRHLYVFVHWLFVALLSLCKNLGEKCGPAFIRWLWFSGLHAESTPINTSGGLISTHRTTSYLRQSRWLTKGNQNMKEEGLKRECQQCDSSCLTAVPRIYLFIAVLLLPH